MDTQIKVTSVDRFWKGSILKIHGDPNDYVVINSTSTDITIRKKSVFAKMKDWINLLYNKIKFSIQEWYINLLTHNS